MKFLRGEAFYFVKWIGYPDSDNTWEPERYLGNSPEIPATFKQKFATKKNNNINVNWNSSSRSSSSNLNDAVRKRNNPKNKLLSQFAGTNSEVVKKENLI